ncbi:FAD:protein FMN transferase [Maribrevibacterium harenarium]|uniref:FAD:protein FMN transferase n=1 Tax=Maribrevibacterium harenarium TaxID=2589817 RepID=A0A501X468_9GAMM|nr:FAD:protein FMN transferase [Maribrevibacterium harenarium]TPE55305.1 FAD:protein FMN transferase [Maribrevibacterium harenarium]
MSDRLLSLEGILPTYPRHPVPRVVREQSGILRARFDCMASPCEILLSDIAVPLPEQLTLIANAITEAWRIEHKYSRYEADNTWAKLHQQRGQPQNVDAETQRLLLFANQAWQLSDGLFDITSGILRQCWRFNGQNVFPEKSQVEELLPYIGWQRLQWLPEQSTLMLPNGIELDFGGLGKEYAVERAMSQLLEGVANSETYRLLVNLGGDIAVRCGQLATTPWRIAIEQADTDGGEHSHITLANGAVATSGDTKRHIKHQGKRYGHILNPHTGYPITAAPLSVTVIGHDCIQAGMLATFTQLQGTNALDYIRATGVPFVLQTAEGSFQSE